MNQTGSVSKSVRRGAIAASLASALTGCVSLAGVGGTSEYGCKAPDGVKCESVSGTYANAQKGNLPSQRPRGSQPNSGEAPGAPAQPSAPAAGQSGFRPVAVQESATAAPLRSPPRVLRLWVKGWEDAERDLVGESYLYVQIHDGRWLLPHQPRAAQEAYTPIRPPPGAAKDAQKDAAPAPVLAPSVGDASALAQRFSAAGMPSAPPQAETHGGANADAE